MNNVPTIDHDNSPRRFPETAFVQAARSVTAPAAALTITQAVKNREA
jgi:hypothetical protein